MMKVYKSYIGDVRECVGNLQMLIRNLMMISKNHGYIIWNLEDIFLNE